MLDLGLPGLFDLHTHFLPPRMRAKVVEQFDSAGPLIGRPWPLAYRGSHVRRGQTVGYAGTTGWSTGCHLHFTVLVNGQAVNPVNWF